MIAAQQPLNAFHLLIAGDHTFNDYALLKIKVDGLLSNQPAGGEIVIVSDASRGAAWLGERYAAEMGYEVAEFPEVQDREKVSVIRRNKQMAAIADACICFWNGHAGSSRQLIATAGKAGLEVTIVYI